jgi:DNA polymerase III delta prime subunit
MSKKEEENTEISEQDSQKIINAVAGDIIKTTNLFQAFELVKERAFDWAQNHVSEKMPLEEKIDILKKVSEAEKAAQENSQDGTGSKASVENPEEGSVIS